VVEKHLHSLVQQVTFEVRVVTNRWSDRNILKQSQLSLIFKKNPSNVWGDFKGMSFRKLAQDLLMNQHTKHLA